METSRVEPRSESKGWKGPALAGIAALTLLFLVALALNLSPYLRGPAEWRWAYALPGRPARHAIPVLAVAAYLVVAIPWGRRVVGMGGRSRAERLALLLLVALAAPLIQAALLSAESPDVLRPLFYRTVSAGASGFFSVGSTIQSAADFLSRYPGLMPTFPVHPQRYPPGLPILFYLARRLFEQSPALSDAIGFRLRLYQCHDLSLMRLSNATIATAVVQMALPVVCGLTALPLYGLARRSGGPRVAVWAAILYPLVPSFALWSARWDQFYPLLASVAFYAFYRGLTESRRSFLAGAGLTLALTSLLSFGPLVLLLPMGFFALVWLWARPKRRCWKRLLVDGLVFCAALALPWIVYQLCYGAGFFDIWRVSMSYHLGLARSYWTWLGYHLYDFLVFLGLPLALALPAALFYALRRPRRRSSALVLAFGLGLLALDLAGVARGEVARVWLFLTPLATVAAAHGLERLTRRWWGLVLVAALLATQLLVFNFFLRVVTTGLTDPPARQRVFAPPAIASPLDARLGDGVALLGYQVADQVRPGETLRLTLYWRALAPMAQPYTVFTHLVGPDGQAVGQKDNMPLEDAAPTTCWVPGEVVADTYVIPVAPDAAPGVYTLETGMYSLATGARLPASGDGANADGRVLLTVVRVGE